MDVTFLGTGSAYPSPHRGASALVLRTEGECWLFDCGEGTQTQLMRSQLRAGESLQLLVEPAPPIRVYEKLKQRFKNDLKPALEKLLFKCTSHPFFYFALYYQIFINLDLL